MYFGCFTCLIMNLTHLFDKNNNNNNKKSNSEKRIFFLDPNILQTLLRLIYA